MPAWSSRARRHGGLKAIERKRYEQTRMLVYAAAILGRTEDKEGKEVVAACVEFLRDNPLRVLNIPTEDFIESRMEEADKRTPIAEAPTPDVFTAEQLAEPLTACIHAPGSNTCPCCTTSPQAIAKAAFQSLLEPEPGYSYDDEEPLTDD